LTRSLCVGVSRRKEQPSGRLLEPWREPRPRGMIAAHALARAACGTKSGLQAHPLLFPTTSTIRGFKYRWRSARWAFAIAEVVHRHRAFGFMFPFAFSDDGKGRRAVLMGNQHPNVLKNMFPFLGCRFAKLWRFLYGLTTHDSSSSFRCVLWDLQGNRLYARTSVLRNV